MLWRRSDVFAALLIGGLLLAGSAAGRLLGLIVDGFSTTHLGFANCKNIHGSSLSNFAMLTSLQELELSGTSLVNEDLEQLLKAPWLQRVNLKGTPVTEAGVKAFAKQLLYLRIEWTGVVIQGKKREPDPKDKKKR